MMGNEVVDGEYEGKRRSRGDGGRVVKKEEGMR